MNVLSNQEKEQEKKKEAPQRSRQRDRGGMSTETAIKDGRAHNEIQFLGHIIDDHNMACLNGWPREPWRSSEWHARWISGSPRRKEKKANPLVLFTVLIVVYNGQIQESKIPPLSGSHRKTRFCKNRDPILEGNHAPNPTPLSLISPCLPVISGECLRGRMRKNHVFLNSSKWSFPRGSCQKPLMSLCMRRLLSP